MNVRQIAEFMFLDRFDASYFTYLVLPVLQNVIDWLIDLLKLEEATEMEMDAERKKT